MYDELKFPQQLGFRGFYEILYSKNLGSIINTLGWVSNFEQKFVYTKQIGLHLLSQFILLLS